MFLTLTAVDISVVFTAKSLAVEELGVGALLHVLGEAAVHAGLLLVGTVVVQLALSGVREHGRLVLLASLLHRQRLWGRSWRWRVHCDDIYRVVWLTDTRRVRELDPFKQQT